MIFKFIPTEWLKGCVDKSTLLLYDRLDNIPIETCADSGFSVYFNLAEPHRYYFDQKSSFSIWYANGAGFAEVRFEGRSIYGGDFGFGSFLGLVPGKELFNRLARRKRKELRDVLITKATTFDKKNLEAVVVIK